MSQDDRILTPEEVKKIEGWIFRQQGRLWVAAIVTLILMGAFFVVYKTLGLDRPSADIVPPPEKITASPSYSSDQFEKELAENPSTRTFQKFVHVIVAIANETEGVESEMGKRLYNKPINWSVTVDSIQTSTLGPAVFFKETAKLTENEIPIHCWLIFRQTENPKVTKLKSGQKITVRGRIGPITSIRSTAFPQGAIQVTAVDCVLEK